jgi:Uma2 family endonuclease
VALPVKRYTPEEYFAIERETEIRHEFVNGEIFAMSGGSRAHERIVSDVDTSLNNQLRGGNCEVFASNMRLKISERKYLYADLSVVCGEADFATDSGLDSLLNPTLLIEVLSPSTEGYNRTTKFVHYQALDSLREYVLISQLMPLIEVYTRQSDDKWLYMATQGLDSTVTLESIGCTLTLSEVYRRVTFEDDDLDHE